MGRAVAACVLALFIFIAGGCASGGDSDAVVRRFSAALTVLEDGRLDVEERMLVALPANATTFRRRSEVFRHDGVVAPSGELDGRSHPLQVGSGPALDVTWQFAPAAGVERAFTLRYRLAGAVETSGMRGTVSWRFQNAYAGIPDARFTITLPPGAVLLEDPWVLEAGFEVDRLANGMRAQGEVGAGAVATPGAAFTIDPQLVAEPRWQYHRRRARELMPAFVSAGLFLVVIGAGAVAMIRLKYPPWRLRAAEPLAEVRLPPEVEAALVRERYPKPVLAAMIADGLIDAERMQVARDLRRAAGATLALGALTWGVADLALGHLGRWPLSIPVGILLSAAMFLGASHRISILSPRGVQVRARVLYSARVRDGQTTA